jgi:hypothetical protein
MRYKAFEASGAKELTDGEALLLLVPVVQLLRVLPVNLFIFLFFVAVVVVVVVVVWIIRVKPILFV